MHDVFARRWKPEYLKELHGRHKRKNTHRNVEVEDMVVIRKDNLPSISWRLGRVLRTYPGHDDYTRVVDLCTSHATFKRPITKLVFLSNPNIVPYWLFFFLNRYVKETSSIYRFNVIKYFCSNAYKEVRCVASI